MQNEKKVSRITAIVNRAVSTDIVTALKSEGLHFHIATGRASVLQEKKGIFAISLPGINLVNDPVDIVSILVTPEIEDSIINFIVNKAKLNNPGRGSIYSDDVILLKSHELCMENKTGNFQSESTNIYSDLIGICCIVQRGYGDFLSRVVLNTGTCVPTITFGIGTGLRDKLGLLRITIPAEKEVINLVTSSYDSENVMDMMIDAGKLDQPGKGFIYLYPVKKGIINTKISHGVVGHAASIEQIISAIDDLKGGMEWRYRETMIGEKSNTRKLAYMKDLVNLTLTCDEGKAQDLVKAAMEVGSPGATISLMKFFSSYDSSINKVSPARECCSMIVSLSQVNDILKALENTGAFDDTTHGQVFVHPVPKACTYHGKTI